MYGGLHSPRPLPREDTLLVLARAFTPRVEARAPTPVLLDLHGLGRVWPTPEALGRALLAAARARAIEMHVALAFSRTTALVVAQARSGLTIVPAGGEANALAPLPLALLGLDPERQQLLRRWGLRTIGDLQRLPAVGLAERAELLQVDLLQARLFLQLPPGGLFRRFPHVDEPARQGPMPGVRIVLPLDQEHLQVFLVQAEYYAVDG